VADSIDRLSVKLVAYSPRTPSVPPSPSLISSLGAARLCAWSFRLLSFRDNLRGAAFAASTVLCARAWRLPSCEGALEQGDFLTHEQVGDRLRRFLQP
jgi:hypothetical protein